MIKPTRRSPLKAAPLRQPGASIQEDIDRLREDVIFDRLMLVFAVFAVWVMALVMWLFPTSPGFFFGMASVAFVGVAAWSIPPMLRTMRKIDHLCLGLARERAVAELLDLVAHDGFWVVHDLRGEGFNVDHVIVGTQGVFTIETKALSKPSVGDAIARFDGATLTIDDYVLDHDPLILAWAQAGWVRQTLEELTGARRCEHALEVDQGRLEPPDRRYCEGVAAGLQRRLEEPDDGHQEERQHQGDEQVGRQVLREPGGTVAVHA
jgi:hypothetical protein